MLNFYQKKRVFVTGHTGFKAAWLCLWLQQFGAEVAGYSLAPEENPDNLFLLIGLDSSIDSRYGDIRNYEELTKCMKEFKPEIVFHMAAQALVLPSYEEPLQTYETNIMGTAHVLEAARKIGCVKAIVNVTTDKCYENNETGKAFKESDHLGGHDPYSSSKAAAEIISSAYRHSFLAKQGIHMATARAGNVIGGGDFSKHRLIPDIIRAAKLSAQVNLRQPESIRPWQHVFDVLRGYLMLGQALYEQGEAYAQAFNFGPNETNINVLEMANKLAKLIKNPPLITTNESSILPEAKLLNLDNSKVKAMLGWNPKLTSLQAIENTANWYSHYLENPETINDFSCKQLASYIASL